MASGGSPVPFFLAWIGSRRDDDPVASPCARAKSTERDLPQDAAERANRRCHYPRLCIR